MPRYGKGLYPVAGCVQWYVDTWKVRALAREGDTEKKRSQQMQNAILEAKMREATGHLVDKNEVVMVWSGAFLRLGRMLDALPASIGRELNLDPDALRIIRARIDEARTGFVRDSQEYIDVVDVESKASGTRAKKRA